MTYVFYTLAGLLVAQGVFSLIEGLKFGNFVRRSLAAPRGSFAPAALIIAPCRGLDCSLEDNLRALFDQHYPDYEILFAVGSKNDPSLPIIERLILQHSDRQARIVIAGPNCERSDKVNNLLAAIERASPESEAFAFVDSDARVHRDWLHSLIAPLAEKQTGATTGYRWHLPTKGGLWSALLSAWNGSVATSLGDHSRNFAWGGSTAILRDTFERAGIRQAWQRALSDDYALTRAVQQAGLSIRFVPACLIPWDEDATFFSLLEFTTRQVAITRVYRPRMWWVGLVSHALFVLVFFGGIALTLSGGVSRIVSTAMLVAIYALGSAKGALRLLAAREAISEYRNELSRLWWMYCLMWPLVAVLFLYNFLRSALSRRITWRGLVYEMRSPTETIVIGREKMKRRMKNEASIYEG